MYPDVFLSFRGQDVRRSLVSHLYRELSQNGIRSFLEEEEEEKEKHRERQVSPSLLRAISESKLAVVVLSEYYASSRWCLDELDKIMGHAGKKLMAAVPVFYEVDYCDVRYQRGRFGEEFERHGQEENPETLQRWRDALINLTSQTGFSSHDSEDDSKLVREITRYVSGLLSEFCLLKEFLPGDNKSTAKKTSSSRVVSNSDQLMTTISGSFTRLCHQLFKVIAFLTPQGIGKTSILSSLYQKLTPLFEDHYLLKTSKNIHDQGLVNHASSLGSRKELPSPRGLKRKALQTSSDVGSDDERTMFWNQKRALVIVDNVKTITQIRGDHEGSCGVEHVYEVDYLKYDEALELFSQCAFKKQYPPTKFEQQSVRAVQLTGCLPLGLKLLGSFLCGRTKEDWERELQSLEAKQGKAIVELLKNSAKGVPPGPTKEDCEREERRLKAKDKAILELLRKDWEREMQRLGKKGKKRKTLFND
ncbi:disease resistance protein TAO1-like [Brassica napus]|uniref:disease resistance protein TAO1-like n=1 Tax=Brassica napus TaxID=3708 RepID=UPI0006AB48A2|nr:disease resistance protein TAO1-like [Brassica napus]